ncbi:putative wd repeat protein [Phaeomoniella chlamydospora]|uniref:Putative wd repeat protein n=1 Tax=Phaeomoniella chlamydospora TaxID=158046 RepID=A0A0G2E1G0_PHACM|nr:putative wd repeat protein [Phaeomoniella chlamydospora]
MTRHSNLGSRNTIQQQSQPYGKFPNGLDENGVDSVQIRQQNSPDSFQLGENDFVERLNAAAAINPALKKLVQAVASNEANQEQLEAFQKYIDRLTAMTAREKTEAASMSWARETAYEQGLAPQPQFRSNSATLKQLNPAVRPLSSSLSNSGHIQAERKATTIYNKLYPYDRHPNPPSVLPGVPGSRLSKRYPSSNFRPHSGFHQEPISTSTMPDKTAKAHLNEPVTHTMPPHDVNVDTLNPAFGTNQYRTPCEHINPQRLAQAGTVNPNAVDGTIGISQYYDTRHAGRERDKSTPTNSRESNIRRGQLRPTTADGNKGPPELIGNPTRSKDSNKLKQVESRSSIHASDELTKMPSLAQQRDHLRTRLLTGGIWFEDVDRIIHECEGNAVDTETEHLFGMVLMPSDSDVLTLEQSIRLLGGLDWGFDLNADHANSDEEGANAGSVNLEVSGSNQTMRSPPVQRELGAELPQSRSSPTGDMRLETSAMRRDVGSKKDIHQSIRKRDTIAVPNTQGSPCPRPQPIQAGKQNQEAAPNSQTQTALDRVMQLGNNDRPVRQGSTGSTRATSAVISTSERSQRNLPRQLVRTGSRSASFPVNSYIPVATDTTTKVAAVHKFRSYNQRHEVSRGLVDSLEPIRKQLSKQSDVGLIHQVRLGKSRHDAVSLLRTRLQTKLYPWKSWKGASHDVTHVTWSSTGTKYAVGAAALVDSHTMQYNRPNNLLVGSMVTSTLSELPGHYTQRPGSSNLGLDPRIFQPITAIQWSKSGRDILYTAGYDKTVNIWDVSDPLDIYCLQSERQEERITDIALSRPSVGVLATGTEKMYSTLSLYRYLEDEDHLAQTNVELSEVLPATKVRHTYCATSLQFGTSHITEQYLAAGFSRGNLDESTTVLEGSLALWQLTPSQADHVKVSPCSQNVFDIAWHPTDRLFATANAAPLAERKKMGHVRSMIRVYDPKQVSRLIEYDCPAVDLNTVSFCPFDSNYIAASATDGSTYVYDCRRPDQYVHRLQHGQPLSELPHDRSRELTDVGVRVSLWGQRGAKFYTGGSDGVVKQWDIRKAAPDALVRDVISLEAEVMSGAFSADESNLILGDGSGGIHILSDAPTDDKAIQYVPALASANNDDEEDAWTVGQRAARELVETGQIEIVPGWGAGKGERYKGPWASWATEEDRKARKLHRRKTKRARSSDFACQDDIAHSIERDTIVISSQTQASKNTSTTSKSRAQKKKQKNVKTGSVSAQGLGRRGASTRPTKDGSQFIDLTLSDDDSSTQMTTNEYMDTGFYDVDESWFPPHWMVGANFRAQEV